MFVRGEVFGVYVQGIVLHSQGLLLCKYNGVLLDIGLYAPETYNHKMMGYFCVQGVFIGSLNLSCIVIIYNLHIYLFSIEFNNNLAQLQCFKVCKFRNC